MTENWLKGYRYAICIDRWILHSWWSDAKTVRCDKLGLSSARPFNNKDKTKENLKSTVLDARALPEKMRHIMVSTSNVSRRECGRLGREG